MKPDTRNTLICALLPVLVALATLPWANISTFDDYSYAFTTREFARTGTFTYNGWATAMIGVQVLIGALFVKLFGFSFYALRAVGVLFAAGASAMGYRVAREAHLEPPAALLATLTCTLSVLGIALTPTYMTDLSGLFFLLLTLYLFIRAGTATERAAILWCLAGCIAGFLGGTIRQILWSVPLLLLVFHAWQFRANRLTLGWCALFGVGILVSVKAVSNWYVAQPFSITDLNWYGFEDVARQIPQVFPGTVTKILLTQMVMLLPVFFTVYSYWAVNEDVLSHYTFFLSLIGSILLTVFVHPSENLHWHFLTNCLTPDGIASSPLFTPQDDPGRVLRRLGIVTRFGLTAIVWYMVVMGTLNLLFLAFNKRPRRAKVPGSDIVWRCNIIGIALFLVSFARLFIGRDRVFYDRYLLPLVFLFGVALLWHWQRSGEKHIFWLSRIALGIQLLCGIIVMHNHFAAMRATLLAVNLLQKQGVPRSQIIAGEQFDAWTQMEEAGSIYDDRLRPEDKAKLPPSPRDSLSEQYAYRKRLPSIHPRYQIVAKPFGSTASTATLTVPYRTWSPPFQRAIRVYEIRK